MTESEIPQNNDGEIPYLEKKRLPISWVWSLVILGVLSIGVGKYCMMNEYLTLAEVFTIIGLCSILQTLFQMRLTTILEVKQQKCMEALDTVLQYVLKLESRRITIVYAEMGITLTVPEQIIVGSLPANTPSVEEIVRFREIVRACKMHHVSLLDWKEVKREMDWLLSLNSESLTKLFKKTMGEIQKDGDMMRRISQEMKRDFSGFDLQDRQNLPTLLAEQLHTINEYIELWATVLRARYRVDQISLEEAKQLDAEIQERIVKPREQIAEYIKAHYKILVLVSGKQ